MKSLDNIDFIEFLLCDYIYLPYINKEELQLRSDYAIYKDDILTNINGKNIYSPVSGKIYGLSEISGKKVLIVENDFKDKTAKRKINIKDIYKISKDEVKRLLPEGIYNLIVYKNNKYDLRDNYLLNDYTKELLNTLDIMAIANNTNVKILIDRNDLISYQILFNYIEAYPNIDVSFDKKEYGGNIYEILDIYYKLKNRARRDFIYFTLITKNKIYVIKTKKYSNLKELLTYLKLNYKEISVNNKKISDSNFLLDDSVYYINIL